MIKNQSDKPEKLQPQDSERKDIEHPKDDEEAVVKPEDKKYRKEDAILKDPATLKENSEQPVNPVK